MCGIVGIVNRDGAPASPVLLKRMSDALLHRGPDGEGVWTEGPVGFGHRRLAIIDLTPAGHQPMQTPDGRFTITYNGEVYNFQELRLELEARGHQFRSRSDTEVVLTAFAEWGLDAIPRLNGIFALALHDRERRETLLVRDRYGVKPLYYAELGATLIFGSETKAFFPHPAFAIDIDREGLVEYLTFQNFITDRSLFRGVRLLPAGTWMRVPDDASRPVERRRYWDFHFAEPLEKKDRAGAVEELDRLFSQAVSRQLVSDVPVGTYLSGGMDSASITAVAARQLPDLRSFTVGFDLSSASGLELGFDERAPAERVSYLCRTEHYEMVLKAGDMERCMRSLVWHLEEPRVGQSYPNFYAAKLASRFGKVVLSGAGGDELFGGYPWRYYRAAVNTGFDDYIGKYYGFWQRLLPADATPGIFAPIRGAAANVDPVGLFRDVFADHASNISGPEDYINHSLYFEAKTFLHGLLVVEDKVSMAHGLESRIPFLDNDLVDFGMRVPVGWKLGNLGEVVRLNENEPGPKTSKYFERTRDGKLILREAMARYVPTDVTQAVKQGFSAPDASWFRGESIEYVRRLLGRNAAIYEFLDRATVQRLVDDHLEGRENRRLLIWSLLCLETWCAVFLAGARAARA
jgi:asparagine synthase (glutamine-hydrolysing)